MSDVQSRISIVPEVKGASAAASELGRIFRELQEGSKTAKEANAAMREYSGAIRAQSRAQSLIRTEWRNNNAALVEQMRILRSVSGIGRTMTNVVQTVTLQQMRMADETRDVRDAEMELLRVQGLRKTAMEDLGIKSVYAQSLLTQENALTRRLTEEKRDLRRAQVQNIAMWASTSIELVGVIPRLVDIVRHTDQIRAILGSAWNLTSITGLKGALGSALDVAKSLWDMLTSMPGAPSLPSGAAAGGAAGSILDDVAAAVGGSAAATAGVVAAAGLGAVGLMTLPDILAYQAGGKVISPFAELMPEGMREEMFIQKGVQEEYDVADIFGKWREEELAKKYSVPTDYVDAVARRDEKVPIVVNQNINIRHVDDKQTVRKITDATMDALEYELR